MGRGGLEEGTLYRHTQHLYFTHLCMGQWLGLQLQFSEETGKVAVEMEQDKMKTTDSGMKTEGRHGWHGVVMGRQAGGAQHAVCLSVAPALLWLFCLPTNFLPILLPVSPFL